MKLTRFLVIVVFFQAVNTYTYAQDKKILFVSAAHTNKAKVTLIRELVRDKAFTIDQKSEKALRDLNQAKAVFESYDLVVFDAVSPKATKDHYDKYQSLVKSSKLRFLPIASPGNDSLKQGLSADQAEALFQYYDNGGAENFSRMLDYLSYRVFDTSDKPVESPIVYPRAGLYRPDYDKLVFASLEELWQWENGQENTPTNKSGTSTNDKAEAPVIGLFISRAAIESSQTQVIDTTIEKLEEKGVRTITAFYETGSKSEEYLKLFQNNGQTVVDAFINFRTIHFANQRKWEFEKLGKPVIQALTYFDGNQQAWEASAQGISAGMMAFTLVLPETAGVIDPIIIAAVNRETGGVEVIDYQLDYLVERSLKYVVLANKHNAQKKLTLMFWGDKDMGASFLNVPDSLYTISSHLGKQGYQLEAFDQDYYIDRALRILSPFYRSYELEALLADDLADLLPVHEYRAWLSKLPQSVVEPINEFWGEPENNFMVVQREGSYYFVIPRIRNGNMLIMRQPPRGDSKDQDQLLYHTTTVPMNHYYLAVYYYARESWGSDAFIHLGTHGSQEYLPGKERGLSRYDGGSLTVGSLPVMYPFIVDDVGEAMQTKRRGSAVVVSHMTPPFAAAGLQGVTADIHELMHQYKAMDEGGVKQKTANQIVQLCLDESLCKDFDWSEEQINEDFDGFLSALHDYLGELAAENQPLGLHSFGELAEQNLIISTIVQMLGAEFIEQASGFEAHYYDGAHHHHHTHQHTEQHGGLFHENSTDMESLAGFKTVRDFVLGSAEITKLNKNLRQFVTKGKQDLENMHNIQELENLVAGLAGQYIPVKTGGDPIRHPESLPTGLNLYGFDPARLPTKAAYAQGEELVEDLIANYYKEHGRYPAKMAFSLWSIEAMRHYGVLEGQAMKAMGVRPVWSNDGRVIDTEIIEASELKRPRVDIVLSATGLYRDAFPNVMQRLAKVIQQVAQLKEEGNSLWASSQRIKAQLIKEGVEEEEAEYLSTVRIFSSASGQYGSGVDGPVFNSDTWETDAKIADNYLAKMGYYFGADNKRWGQRVDGLYGKQLSGTEIVAFSRSSNLYGMITTDDPFEYFGSLALAVRSLDGRSPEMMISNLRDAEHGKMERTSTFLAKELRTRNFNKRWIEEMQKEGYSGAVAFAGSVANFWGWQVVDPKTVREDQWQEFFEIYVEDKLELDINQWFEQVNPASQVQLLERMLEAVRKEYWAADEAVLRTMVERYQTLITEYDLMVDNEKLRELVNHQATGFGLNTQLPAPELQGAIDAGQAQQVQEVQGQRLEKVEVRESKVESDYVLLLSLLACLLFVTAGFLRQANRALPVAQF